MRRRARRTPVIWLVSDQRPGHRNQLKGLGNRLRVLSGASTHWVDATQVRTPVWRALLGVAPKLDLPKPDLVIGAGSGTHRLLLALRHKRNVRTLVLMKPSFPLSWVDAAILPEHDQVKPGKRVLLTEGVINNIMPMAKLTTKPEALVLVGGPSKHYEWDNDLVFSQLLQLMQAYPNWRWTVSSTRRTPAELGAQLEELAGPKTTVTNPGRSHEDWLAHTLAAVRAVWVTPDSGSMVYEALTAGIPTGLFELAPKANTRIVRSVEALLSGGRAARWQDHHALMAPPGETGDSRQVVPTLWEADRAARWVLDTLVPGMKP
ncbi:mitochondrial fission ELM1 family protein [Marinobacter salicampi]|uniref:mitochondrial fission ELM1 family protein n=1 Tax=Marinobacter salicampi TaxID=435907 RepID=UPI00140D4C9E|nr:ELM1/GtrOC1 family putative glycosyltransferase [Marinobacter salicampi]